MDSHWRKTIAVIVCIVLSLLVIVLQTTVTTEAFKSDTLDHSWIVGLAASIQQGQVSGRDFFFNYGVLSQLLARLAMVLNPNGSAVDSFFAIVLIFRAVGFVLWGIVLLLIQQVDWKFVLFVFLAAALLNLMFDIASLRMVWIVLCAVLLARAMAASTFRRQVAWGAIVGGMCFAAQLFTAELGLLTLAATMLTLGIYALLAQWRHRLNRADLGPVRRYILLLGVAAGVFVLGNGLISLLFKLTSPDYVQLFDYQYYNLEIIRGHNNTMGIAWRPGISFSLGLSALILYAVCFVSFYWRRLDRKDGYLLVSLLVASLVALKGLVLRSDWSHIMIACIPLIFLLLLLGHDWLGTRRIRPGWVASMLLLVAIWPNASFSALAQLPRSLDGKPSWSEQWQAITTFRAPADELVPAGLADAVKGTAGPLLIFPYQNYIATQLNRTTIAPVLLAVLAHTEVLQSKYVELLDRGSRDLQVIYGMDGLASWPVDGVQQITRVPAIFEYLYRHFELQSSQAYGEGYYLLHRRPTPIDFQGVQLDYHVDHTGPASVLIHLAEPAACSLVRLELNLSYPVTALIGRPESMHAQFSHEGAVQVESNLLALETGKDFATDVSLIEPARFYQVFGADPVQTKAWDTLAITPVSTGLFGASPDLLDVKRIECVTFPR